MKCGERLKTLRTQKKETQLAIAKKIGMRQPHYARYESNERDTPIEKIIALADYYGVSTDYLLGRTDEQKPYPPAEQS